MFTLRQLAWTWNCISQIQVIISVVPDQRH